jgi:hypothetical protein
MPYDHLTIFKITFLMARSLKCSWSWSFLYGERPGKVWGSWYVNFKRKIVTSPILWKLCFSSYKSRAHVIVLQFLNIVVLKRKRCKIYLVEIKIACSNYTWSSVHNLYFACMSSANYPPSSQIAVLSTQLLWKVYHFAKHQILWEI